MGTYSHLSLSSRLGHGIDTLWGVATQVMPDHIGYAVLPLFAVGLAQLLKGRANCPRQALWLSTYVGCALLFFAATVTLSAYQPDHNLYWKWLSALVPGLLLLAAHGVVRLLADILEPKTTARLLLALTLGLGLSVATGLDWSSQTRSQLQRSDRWYGTQVRLMRWIEANYPADVGIVADLIPSTFVARREHSMRFFSWSHPELPHDSPQQFGRWLLEQDIAIVIWFREDWVGASQAAPYLHGGWPTAAGPVRLNPLAREDGYGFIAYEVLGNSRLTRPTTIRPPANAGAVNRN